MKTYLNEILIVATVIFFRRKAVLLSAREETEILT
jgi:hypothetical protein